MVGSCQTGKKKIPLAESCKTESESGLISRGAATGILRFRRSEMADDDYLTYPGFNVSFLVPPQHDTNKLDRAIAEIKRDVSESAERRLPANCQIELQDTV